MRRGGRRERGIFRLPRRSVAPGLFVRAVASFVRATRHIITTRNERPVSRSASVPTIELSPRNLPALYPRPSLLRGKAPFYIYI